MALKRRRAEERFIPQSTRAAGFKRMLDGALVAPLFHGFPGLQPKNSRLDAARFECAGGHCNGSVSPKYDARTAHKFSIRRENRHEVHQGPNQCVDVALRSWQ